MSSSKDHFRCTPCAEFQTYAKQVDSNGLYVSDLHPQATEDELYNLFNHYGQVVDFYMPENGTYCLVHFRDRQAVNDLLTYPIGIFGRELRIRPRFPSKADEDKRAELNDIHKNHNEVLKSISEKSDFMDQVRAFLKASEAGETEIQRQYEVCKDIENALKNISSIYKVMPFGSSVNGLAFKQSDLDLFYGKEIHCNAPDVHDVFRKAKLALEKLNLIESLKPIPNARVPIIKFIHKSTGYNCDLSFRNTMGVQNSQLIKFLISLDSRVKPFFMIIKYWAKLHNLTGRRMSNYALALLMICFLQSLNDPILPPLYKLQHDGVAARWVSGWNAGFDDDPTRLKPISNNLSLEELLTQFFASIVKTDFVNSVLCPYLGCILPKESFYNMGKLPCKLDLYVRNVRAGKCHLKAGLALCLQDPIELNLNVTKNVAEHDLKCFREHCIVAAQLSHAVPPHLFLSELLSTSYDYLDSSNKKTWLPNPMHVRPVRPFMTLHIPYPKNVTDNILWTFELTKKITLIFKKVLKIHVEDEKKGVDTKPGSDQDFICKGSQVLWVGRDKLWNLWFSKSSDSSDDKASHSKDIVEVLDISKPSGSVSSGGEGEKRKRGDEQNGENKKRKMEPVCDQDGNNDSDGEVTVIDLEKSLPDIPVSRSIEHEINLTNDMVKKGHAQPASASILDFSCKICRDTNNVRIEISDRRSKNNYFSSLCAFLEEFLNKHVIESLGSPE